MIDKIASISVYVRDQQRSREFYSKALGFNIEREVPMGPDGNWLEVAPSGAATKLVIFPGEQFQDRIGLSTGIILNTDDIAQDYATLKDRGVEFDHEPKAEFWGTFTTFYDLDRNSFMLVQPA